MTAAKETLPTLVSMSGDVLTNLAENIVKNMKEKHLTSVDREAVGGDDASLPHATFPATPFERELKKAVKKAAEEANLTSNFRFADVALKKAAKVYQQKLLDHFNKFSDREMKRKGAFKVLTADVLAGRAPPAAAPKKKEKKEKKQKKKEEKEEDSEPKEKKKKGGRRKREEDKPEEKPAKKAKAEEPKEKKEEKSEEPDEKKQWDDAVSAVKGKKKKLTRRELTEKAAAQKYERMQKEKDEELEALRKKLEEFQKESSARKDEEGTSFLRF